MSEITGYIDIPFHGESAYEIAVKHGYSGTEEEWIENLGKVDEEELSEIMKAFGKRLCGYSWNIDTDEVFDRDGKSYGKLTGCMNGDFVGAWFYVKTSKSEAGSGAYPASYQIDGANGYLSLRDYVVWTGVHLVHIPTFEAKGSNIKNEDGKYSPRGGVDGLMSSTDKAYLGDLVKSHWGKTNLPVFRNTADGHMVNWCRDDGWYTGGLKKDCGGHPPVLKDNHTSWALLVLNGMATDETSLNHNHRIQIAFDLVNSKIYIRRGWMNSNDWVEWSEVGGTIAENTSDVVFTENEAEVTLLESIKEVVATGEVNLNILLPEKPWKYWRCILNFTQADTVNHFDVGFNNDSLFGIDSPWEAPVSGKTYMLLKVSDNQSPRDYNLIEVDNITRMPIG